MPAPQSAPTVTDDLSQPGMHEASRREKLRRLEELGVARLSVGSGPMRAVMGLTRRMAEELRDLGTWSRMLEDTIPYAEANELMKN